MELWKKRKHFTPEQKAKIVIEVIKGERTLNEIAAEYEFIQNLLSRWKTEFISNAGRVFSKETDEVERSNSRMKRRRTNCLSKLVNYHMRLPGLKKNLASSKSREDRMKMIDRNERTQHNKASRIIELKPYERLLQACSGK